MTRILGIVAGKEIVENGFFIFRVGDIIEFSPFSDDLDYKVKFTVDDPGENKSKTDYKLEDDGVVIITHQRGWFDGKATAHLGSRTLATDDDYKYFISFSIVPMGVRTKFAYQMSFTISREPKNG